MTVVSAGVHDARVLRGVFCAGIFGDGQGVHVEAQEDGGTGFGAFQVADYAGLADAFGHFDAKGFKFFGNNSAGADFVVAKFGVHVKITAHGLGVGEEFFGFFEKGIHCGSIC